MSVIHTGGTPKKSSLFRRSILDKDLTGLVRTGGGGEDQAVSLLKMFIQYCLLARLLYINIYTHILCPVFINQYPMRRLLNYIFKGT